MPASLKPNRIAHAGEAWGEKQKLITRRMYLVAADWHVRDCPSLVGGRPAKSVVEGRVGSNPTSRAILVSLVVGLFLV